MKFVKEAGARKKIRNDRKVLVKRIDVTRNPFCKKCMLNVKNAERDVSGKSCSAKT